MTIRSLLLTSLLGAAALAGEAVPPASTLIGSHPHPGGVAVVVGTGAPTLELALAEAGAGDWLVLGLRPRSEPLRVHRAAVLAAGQGGVVTVDGFDGKRLPLNSDMANLVVAGPGADEAEVLRVLRPEGVAWIAGPAGARRVVKPYPTGMGEWTHWMGNADGNNLAKDTLIKPTRSIQWIAGAAAMAGTGNKSGARLAGGMHYAEWAFGGELEANRFQPRGNQAVIAARDAFNGLSLWQIPQATGRPGILAASATRLFFTPERNGPLVAYDRRTGQEALRYTQGLTWTFSRDPSPQYGGVPQFRVAVEGERMVQTSLDQLVVLDVASGRRVGGHTAPAGHTYAFPVLGGGRGYAVLLRGEVRYARSWWGEVAGAIAVDLATGAKVWEWSSPADDRGRAGLAVYADERLFIHHANVEPGQSGGHPTRLSCLDAKTGRRLWTQVAQPKPNDPPGFGAAGNTLSNLFVRGDEVIAAIAHMYAVFDVRSGALKESKRVPGWGCEWAAATQEFLVFGNKFWIDQQGRGRRDYVSRSGCTTGNTIGYGMMFVQPNSCVCAAYLRGFMALHGRDDVAMAPDAQRLVAGPAAARAAAATIAALDADAWPTHGRDPRLTHAVATAPSLPLRVRWRSIPLATPLGGQIGHDASLSEDWRVHQPLTQASSAEGLLLVASSHRNAVHALDPATGAVRWTFPTAGRVLHAPLIAGGIAYVATSDGWVHAINGADGALCWSHLAAPGEQRMVAHGQLESLWPAQGPLLLVDGGLVGMFGRHGELAGGLVVVRLDPRTGAVQARRSLIDTLTWMPTWDRAKNQPDRSRFLGMPLGFDGTSLRLSDGTPIDARTLADATSTAPFIQRLEGTATSEDYAVPQVAIGNFYFTDRRGFNNQISRLGRITKLAVPAGERLAIATDGTVWSPICSRVVIEHGKPGLNPVNDRGLYRWTVDAKTGHGSARKVTALMHAWRGGVREGGTTWYVGFAVAGNLGLGIRNDPKTGTGVLDVMPLDGSAITQIPLPGAVAYDGLSVAHGRVYVTLLNGTLVALGG